MGFHLFRASENGMNGGSRETKAKLQSAVGRFNQSGPAFLPQFVRSPVLNVNDRSPKRKRRSKREGQRPGVSERREFPMHRGKLGSIDENGIISKIWIGRLEHGYSRQYFSLSGNGKISEYWINLCNSSFLPSGNAAGKASGSASHPDSVAAAKAKKATKAAERGLIVLPSFTRPNWSQSHGVGHHGNHKRGLSWGNHTKRWFTAQRTRGHAQVLGTSTRVTIR